MSDSAITFLILGVVVAFFIWDRLPAFLTPFATPANLMVMEPAGSATTGKLGLPLLALYGVVAVLLVPVIWSF